MKPDNLPSSDDEMWEGSDINKIKMTDSPECKHSFTRTKGSEVVCRCGIGYFLSPGFELREGHIYNGEQLVI